MNPWDFHCTLLLCSAQHGLNFYPPCKTLSSQKKGRGRYYLNHLLPLVSYSGTRAYAGLIEQTECHIHIYYMLQMKYRFKNDIAELIAKNE